MSEEFQVLVHYDARPIMLPTKTPGMAKVTKTGLWRVKDEKGRNFLWDNLRMQANGWNTITLVERIR